ncbi:MAG: thioredoxin-like domain-containing protein [Ferruginibacter sp.]|nr:redoxin domain-containing protein [Ferruginibacter sp.]
MKKNILVVILTSLSFNLFAQGYTISLKSNYKYGLAYLTYYMGKDLMLQDSAAVNNKGVALFKGATKLPPGIYSLVMPGKRLTTDFLIDKEQNITLLVDSLKPENIQITGSIANVDFKAYQNFVNAKGKFLQQEKNAYNTSKSKADSAKHEAAYAKLSKELNVYRENLVKQKPNSMMAILLHAMREPAYPTNVPITRKDSVDNYNFYKAHYWDGITFMDDRIIRTPFFLPKLENYYRQIMPQAPDSLIKDIDYKLLLARTSPEMYKFLLNWVTDEYINPKYMGQDAVFVHLYEKYHSKGLSKWLNKVQDSVITRRAFMLMSNLIGVNAANVEFADTLGKTKALYDVDADYTLLVFWDPNCGHCKTEIPKIDSIYRASWKQKNVKIFAVLSESEKQKEVWLDFIRANKITDWVNVYQTKAAADAEAKDNRPSYRQLFDIVTTPTIILLDKEKRIIAKKLTLEQLDEFLKVKINKK